MNNGREFDVVVYGASGFTGRLVADYMQRAYGAGSNVTWAMAGRDDAKLKAIKTEIGAAAPVISANARDPASLEAMAAAHKGRSDHGWPLPALRRTLSRRVREDGDRLRRPLRRAELDGGDDRKA